MNHHNALYQTCQIRDLESHAIHKLKITEHNLMQRAGEAAFETLQQAWPLAKTVLVICGRGNNGGDGYVLAQCAHKQGIEVLIARVGEIEDMQGAALAQAQACSDAGIEIAAFAAGMLRFADVVVDAMLGIGLSGEVRGEYAKIINKLNASEVHVLALDVPSGLDADTGAALGTSVVADVTQTFIGLKVGLFTGLGIAVAGQVVCDELGISAAAFKRLQPYANLLFDDLLLQHLPLRSRDAHKGDFGHVLVIGGDHGMAGAVRMAGEAALRVGAGLVSVATHAEHIDVVSATRPELMCHAVESVKALAPLLDKATAIVLGPGLGQSKWSQSLWQAAIETGKPKIVDADGLNLLVNHPTFVKQAIITPHPGEASRLLGLATKEVQQDRFAVVHQLRQEFAEVAVLKGAGSLVCDGELSVCHYGNPGMATAGMGDVLSGVIGGLLAQQLSLADAARVGVLLHAKAGDKAAKFGGERGIIASDLMLYLHRLCNPK